MDSERFTEGVARAVVEASSSCLSNKNPEVCPVHLALVMLQDKQGLPARIVSRAHCDVAAVEKSLEIPLSKLSVQEPPARPVPSGKFLKVINKASDLQKRLGDGYIALDVLFVALFEDSDVTKAFGSTGLTKQKAEEAMHCIRGTRKVESRNAESTFEALRKYAINVVELAEQGKLDPVIGRDDEIRRVIRVLCRRTKNNPVLVGDPGVGKTAIVEGLAQRIVQGDVPHSLQVQLWSLDMGALIAGASFRGEFEERLKAVLKEVQDSAGGVVIFIDEIHLVLGAGRGDGAMDAANLLKPMLARGELRCIGATTIEEYRKHVEKDAAFERRFQQVYVGQPSVTDTISILRGLKDRYSQHHGVQILDSALIAAAQLADRYITHRFLPDKAIDLVDEACASVRVQLDSQPEIIDQLERRKLQLEVEQQAFRRERGVGERMSQVQKALANINEQLRPLKAQLEAERSRTNELRDLKLRLDGLKAKAESAERRQDYALAADLRYGAIPDIQKKIADLECLTKEMKQQSSLLNEVVGPDQIAEVVSRWTGIPVTRLNETERERLLTLGSRISARVVGQDEAVKAVADSILRSRSGLSNPRKPTGSFLFLGPTGVGKTELAKALAEQLFDSEKNIVRIDMSEYMEQHAVARLIGAPPGYVGHEEGGQLTEAVRRRPYSVILLDEVEKAHANVWNVFLQVLDDGRLTDGKGKTVDFSNTVVILTSNMGAEFMMQSTQGAELTPQAKAQVMEVVRGQFRPEFLNRLDEIVFFRPLREELLRKVVELQAADLSSRLKEKNIQLTLTDRACSYVVQEAYNAVYGARPMRRFLEKNAITPLSRRVISSQLTENSAVTVDTPSPGHPCLPEECFVFTVTPVEPPLSTMVVDEDEDDIEGQPFKLPKNGIGSQ